MIAAVALTLILPVAGLIVSLAVITAAPGGRPGAERAGRAPVGARAAGQRPARRGRHRAAERGPGAAHRGADGPARLHRRRGGVRRHAGAAPPAGCRRRAPTRPRPSSPGTASAPAPAAPRRQLNRMAGVLARTPLTAALTALAVWALAAGAVIFAVSQAPYYWPVMSPHLPALHGWPFIGSHAARWHGRAPANRPALVGGRRLLRHAAEASSSATGIGLTSPSATTSLASRVRRFGPFGDPELLVQPQQVLLDRGFGHHQVGGDLAGGGGHGERLVRQRGPAQRGEHVELAAGQLGRGRPAQFGLLGQVLLRAGRRSGSGPRRSSARRRPRARGGRRAGR